MLGKRLKKSLIWAAKPSFIVKNSPKMAMLEKFVKLKLYNFEIFIFANRSVICSIFQIRLKYLYTFLTVARFQSVVTK